MRQLLFFVSEALSSIRRSLWIFVIAVVTIMLSLLTFGVFLFISINLNALSDHILSKFEMRVFVKQDIKVDQIQHLATLLEGHSSIQEIYFVDKQQAWKSFIKQYPQLALSEFIEENPLPHSFKLVLYAGQDMVEVSSHLKSLSPYIDDIVYGGELMNQVNKFSFFIRIIGVFLVCVLTIATLMIIVNTIRFTVMLRENEINIMSLVGATQGFIRAPFLIEGAIIGLVGALIAVGILRVIILFVLVKLKTNLPYFPFLLDDTIANQVFFLLIITGSFLGVLGAYLSISKTFHAKK